MMLTVTTEQLRLLVVFLRVSFDADFVLETFCACAFQTTSSTQVVPEGRDVSGCSSLMVQLMPISKK